MRMGLRDHRNMFRKVQGVPMFGGTWLFSRADTVLRWALDKGASQPKTVKRWGKVEKVYYEVIGDELEKDAMLTMSTQVSFPFFRLVDCLFNCLFNLVAARSLSELL